MKLIDCIALFKLRYHLSFISVILGAFIFAKEPFHATVIISLLITYCSFNVLLYGGLYTMNDIADIKSDSTHPKKKNRPLPSGKVTVKEALIFSFICITLSLCISYFYFGKNIFLLYVLFIIVNQLYTYIGKKIPYLDIFLNSLTHSMRFLLGAVLVGAMVPNSLFFAVFLFALGFAALRRIIEKKYPGSKARKVLQYYSVNKLILLQILAFALILVIIAMDYPLYRMWYLILVFAYVVLFFGSYFFKRFEIFYQWLFLN